MRGHWRGSRPRLDQHHFYRRFRQTVLHTLQITLDQTLGRAIDIIGLAPAIARDRADHGQRPLASRFHHAGKGFGKGKGGKGLLGMIPVVGPALGDDLLAVVPQDVLGMARIRLLRPKPAR